MAVNKFFQLINRAVVVLLLGSVGSAQAAISLSSTRVIFDAKAQEASLVVRNGDEKKNVLIQSWIESNTPDDQGELPFAMTPPVSKMAPQGQQLIRILYAGGKNTMPSDKESVMWVNVQEIPETVAGENTLQLAVRQRIKLFFRPEGLSGKADTAPSELRWKVNGEVLEIHNPSVYHVSTSSIDIGDDGVFSQIAKGKMIAPGENFQITLKKNIKNPVVEFTSINDFGGSEKYQVQLKNDAASQAVLMVN